MLNRSPTTPEELFATIIGELLNFPEVTPPSNGKKFGSSELKVHGKIFAMLVRGSLVVKLPRSRIDALISSGHGERFDPRRNGQLMKEWIVLEIASQEQWLSLATEAMQFVASKH